MRFSSSVLSGQTDRQNAKEKKSLTNRLILLLDNVYLSGSQRCYVGFSSLRQIFGYAMCPSRFSLNIILTQGMEHCRVRPSITKPHSYSIFRTINHVLWIDKQWDPFSDSTYITSFNTSTVTPFGVTFATNSLLHLKHTSSRPLSSSTLPYFVPHTGHTTIFFIVILSGCFPQRKRQLQKNQSMAANNGASAAALIINISFS